MDPTNAVPSTYGSRPHGRPTTGTLSRVLTHLQATGKVMTPAAISHALQMLDEDVIDALKVLVKDGLIDTTSRGWVARHPKAEETIIPEETGDPGTVLQPDAAAAHMLLREIVQAIRIDGRQRLRDLRTQVEASVATFQAALDLGVRLGTLTATGRGGGTWYDIPRRSERQVETLVQLEPPPPPSSPSAEDIVDGWLADVSMLARMALSESDRCRLVAAIQEALDGR